MRADPQKNEFTLVPPNVFNVFFKKYTHELFKHKLKHAAYRIHTLLGLK